ncbi:MAG: hypothetical protein JO297_18790, partial [Nitrososphaeraceae archaeon]|nr:hypothetical protein [Nitrososphaeraceae archaeon]
MGVAARYSINRLIDSRNCYELVQSGFVIPNNNNAWISNNNNNNHEYIRTIEQIVSRDKGGMIISPQIGLHENVVALDYDSEYENLIVNHNLSYETITLDEGGKEIVVQQQDQQSIKKKGLLPTIVERFLKRRLYFKKMLKQLQKKVWNMLKHYFGITYQDELVVRGIEVRRHDTPNFIKQFQTQLLYTLFDCKDSSDEVVKKGYEDALLLVIQTIDK